MMTQEQRTRLDIAITNVMDVTKRIDSDSMLQAFEAVIEARPDIRPEQLERFSQRASRRADDLERQSR